MKSNAAPTRPRRGNLGKLQPPLPYAFARREEFLQLPLEKRTVHLWEAYAFCQSQIGGKRFSDDELRRNLRVLQRMMLRVAKGVAKRLRGDGTWKNADDPRWPRNHKGDDIDHWYDSGAFPPRFLALPDDPETWRQVVAQGAELVFEEMVAWVETPAGQAGVGDEELQKLLSERPTPTKNPSPSAADSAIEAWGSGESNRQLAIEWFSAKKKDGSLASWAVEVELKELAGLLESHGSTLPAMERLLPELMRLEASGEFERLQRHLDVESPTESTKFAKLRACLPKSR